MIWDLNSTTLTLTGNVGTRVIDEQSQLAKTGTDRKHFMTLHASRVEMFLDPPR